MRRWICKSVLIAALAGLPCACTDTNIYHRTLEPNIPNKVTISGMVCTDDPAQRQFPVRLMFIVDTSASMAESDPELQRRYAVEDIINRYTASPNYTFAILKYAGEAIQLTSGYTKNLAVINEAMAQLGMVDPCVGGDCRNWPGALSLASSVFSGDLLTTNPGTRSRTRWVFVFVANGPPHRRLGSVGGCDEKCRLVAMVEELVEFGKDHGAAEVAFHAVQLDACTGTCQGVAETRHCNSTTPCPPNCAGTESCLPARKLCADNHAATCGDGDAFCTGQGLGGCSPEWLCTGDRQTACDGDAICAASSAGRCEFLRVCSTDAAVTCARDDQCCPTFPCQFPPASQCRPQDDDDTAELLSAMAFRGSGAFLRFTMAPRLNFWGLDFDTTQNVFVKKAFLITNANTKAQGGEILVDSDGDGMSDREEECYGEILSGQCRDLSRCACILDVWNKDTNPLGTDTDPRKADTDGDMLNDLLETRFATVNLDPLRTDLPQACFGLEFPYKDRDADTLNDCEEKLLGTDYNLFDTDRDGYPDQVEFRAGTNPLEADHLRDTDMDGLSNGQELQIHLDPQSNDVAARSGKAYRYTVIDEGLRIVPYTSQPHMLFGVVVTDVSGRSGAGSGTIHYYPAGTTRPDGGTRSYPTISWRDPRDGLPGLEVEIARSGVYLLYSACACVMDCPAACGPGEWCNPSTGACAPDRCALVSCLSTEKCDSYSGRCFPDCTLAECGMGQRCDPLLGRCLTDRCLNVACPQGKSCDPESGVCARAPCDGWVCAPGLRKNEDRKPPWITVRVDFDLLPQAGFWCDGVGESSVPCRTDADCPQHSPCRIRENIVVGMAQKNCISFKVKNITLVETLAVDESFGPGNNNIYAYFAQTPLDNPYAYSIFRVALRQVRFFQGRKDPDWAEFPMGDGDFYPIQEK